MCFAPQRRAICGHRKLEKCPVPVSFFTFWLENVLRATAACNSGTSKMGPSLRCLAHFDLQMCFAPQRRGIFEHQNVQNWSEKEVFCAFWLENMLRTTAACHFSSVCWTATSAPAALARLLFEHQEPRIIEKTQRFATSLTFGARVASFYWLYSRVDLLSSDSTRVLIFRVLPWLLYSAFQLSILSEVRLVNFLRPCTSQ